MDYDKLERQRRIILKEKKINIGLLIFLLFAFVVILWVTLRDIRALFILLILAPLIILLIKWIVENNRLLNQFLTIGKRKTSKKATKIMLFCPKIHFLCVPEVRPHPSLSPSYYGIKILDSKRNQYYYFFEEPLRYHKSSIDHITKKLKGEICIQCYENTTIIQEIENDPHFIHIRYGDLCE